MSADAESALRTQQRLDRASLVHCTIALRHLVQRQRQIEYFARVDLFVPHEVDQLRQETAHRGWATVEMNVSEEQLRTIDLDAVRDADIADEPARATTTDGLH